MEQGSTIIEPVPAGTAGQKTKNRTLTTLLMVAAAFILLLGAFSGGLIVGWAMPDRQAQSDTAAGNPFELFQSGAASSGATPKELETLFAPFWETWNLVHDQYVDQPVDDTLMMRGAIRGMLEALGDPHTSYMDPQEFEQTNVSLQGEYEGIGAWVDITGEYLKIISPMPGSPAEKAGLKPGDVIVKVDGEDMTGVSGDLVLQRVLGPAGTDVTLTVQREGTPEPFDVTITRSKINMPSAKGEMLEDNIAYVQVFTFGEKTMPELRSALKELLPQNPKGLILDLRGNGGGYLNTAIDLLSEFIPGRQVVMYEEFGDGTRKEFKTSRGGTATEIPLVVLVDGGSASASEIVAGAVQDLGRGKLVGMTTFGKGSVQNWIPLENNQGAVRVTIARWLTPNGRQIHKVGLEPDVVVELTEEDVKAERDPQLDRAVEILLGK